MFVVVVVVVVQKSIYHFRPFGRSPKIAMWPRLKRLGREIHAVMPHELSGPWRR